MSPYTEYPYYEFFLQILKALGNPLFVNLYQSTIFFGHPSIMHLGDKAYVYGYMTYLKRATAQILSLCKASDYGPLKALLISLYQNRLRRYACITIRCLCPIVRLNQFPMSGIISRNARWSILIWQ